MKRKPIVNVRSWPTGATRDTNDTKLAYNRFLSPEVLTEYCEYLNRHRDTPAGRREPDNWKGKDRHGLPISVCFESLARHFWEAWTADEAKQPIPMDSLCAILFNCQAIMYEIIHGNYELIKGEKP